MTTHHALAEQADLVNLKDWAGHHVLAKREDIYVPGMIVPTSSNYQNSVFVALKYPKGDPQLYKDIFSSGRFDVISDKVPSLSEVRSIKFNHSQDSKTQNIFLF